MAARRAPSEMPPKRPQRTDQARYEELTERGGTDDCWPWLGKKTRKGYGCFTLCVDGKPREVCASRWGFEQYVRPLAAGEFALHHCDNPPCQNPAHWFAGTKAENTADMVRKGRHRFQSFAGEAHPRARLTAAMVDDIRCRAADGERHYLLAREFEVKQSHINNIVKGRAWRSTLQE